MINVTALRGTRKAYVYYAVGFTAIVMVGLVMKSFNDKIALMTGSVHSYQMMVDQQSNQLKAVSMEKDRLKRDLDDNDASLREMRTSLAKLDKACREQEEKMDDDLNSLQAKFSSLTASTSKLESKYKTMSKSNAEAIADIENLNLANRRLREQVAEASSTRTAELVKLRDSVAKLSQERDKYRDQYSALFKQHQQSSDSIQLLQDEKDRLQEQIREIQRLSGGIHQGKGGAVSSSAIPVVEQPRVMQEPNKQLSSSTSSTPPSVAEVQGAEPRHAELPLIPPPASRPESRVSRPAPLVPAPPQAFSQPPFSKPTNKLNQQVPVRDREEPAVPLQQFFKSGDQLKNFLHYPEQNMIKPQHRQEQQPELPMYRPQFVEQHYNQQYHPQDTNQLQYNHEHDNMVEEEDQADQDNNIDVNQELDEDLDGLQAPEQHPLLFRHNGDVYNQLHPVQQQLNRVQPPQVRHVQQPAAPPVRQLQPIAVRNGMQSADMRNRRMPAGLQHNVQPDLRNVRSAVRNVQPAVGVQQGWGRQREGWQRDF